MDTQELEHEFYEGLSGMCGKDSAAFENNWPYILQATRNGLYIHRGSAGIVYYTKRFPGESLSPTVIVHALGQQYRECVIELAHREHARGIRVLIKNIPIDENKWWEAHGFGTPIERWDTYSLCDDNSFAQYVNDADTIRQAVYSRGYRKMIRQFTRRRQVITEPYTESFDPVARDLLEVFAEYLEKKGVDRREEVVRAQMFFFDTTIQHKIRLQHVEDGELIGWSFLTPVDEVVFYNALVNRPENNLAKYLAHVAMEWVTHNYPNVAVFVDQGSENAGQDWMKRRFGSSQPIHKIHLEYRGER